MNRNDRLFEFLKSIGESQVDYGKTVKASRQQVSNWKAGKPIPDKYMVKTIENYPDIDARWLITGKSSAGDYGIEVLKDKILNLTEQLLAEKERVIDLQAKLIPQE
ncbi:hypothetical protein [Draconibacterium mangrovi]|uniref:hypothetical protein n=1 Tax=Draconibacterium mangrovi TaxID=2697469 RepID=UPI0013D2B5F7|nr:hypothetical protein [Draconibacterium mangrovi]